MRQAIALAGVLLVGCASGSDVDQLRRELAADQASVAALTTQVRALDGRVLDQAAQLRNLSAAVQAANQSQPAIVRLADADAARVELACSELKALVEMLIPEEAQLNALVGSLFSPIQFWYTTPQSGYGPAKRCVR